MKTSTQQFLAVSATISALSLPVVLKLSRDYTTYSYRERDVIIICLTTRSPHSLYINIISFNNETSPPAWCNSDMYNHETTTSI